MTSIRVPTLHRHPDRVLILLLVAAGLLVRLLLLLPTRFDGLYGQDPYAYYDFAGELRTALRERQPLPPFFWPLGYPALLALAQAIFGTTPQIAQSLSIVMGALLPPLVYILAVQLNADGFGAFAAALLVLVCGQVLQSSLVIMADIPALFWAMLSAIFLWQYINGYAGTQNIVPLPLIASALTLALACITRWLYLVLVIPWTIALLIVWRGRVRWRAGLVAISLSLLILLPQALYSRTNPYPVLNHAWVEGWSPDNALRRTFDNVDGHFEYEKINAIFYAQPFYDAYYLAPIFAPFILLGIAALLREKRYAALAMLLGWALLPYLFLIGIPYQNIRFPLIVFPAVVILIGIGIEKAAGWLSQHVAYLGRVALAALLMVGIGMTWNTARPAIDDFLARQQKDKHAAAWTAARVPAGETLYTLGLTLTLQHYTDLNVYEIYYETPETLAAKWVAGRDDYLLLNVWNIENQWNGRDPQRDYHWLRDHRGLTRLGKFDNYVLFRISG